MNDTADEQSAVFFSMETRQELSGQLKQGYLYAVRLLAVTKRSRKELERRLKEKGYDCDVSVQILDRLETQGILNDRALVQDTVQRAVHEKRLGRRRISFELKRKGAEETMIESALLNYSPEDEHANALELAEAQWGKLSRVEPKKRKKRIYDFLTARGFTFELAREIISKIGKSTDEDA